MTTEDEFRRLALALPETEERRTWGQATFRVVGKIFAWLGKERRPAGIRISREERDELIASDPQKFFIIEEDVNHGYLRLRLEAIDPGELQELLTDAWRTVAPTSLVQRFDAEHPSGLVNDA